MAENSCSECGVTTGLWMCLTCGDFSCRVYSKKTKTHANEHFSKTSHTRFWEPTTNTIRDYSTNKGIYELEGMGKLLQELSGSLSHAAKQLSNDTEVHQRLWDLRQQGFTSNCTIRVDDESFTVAKNLLTAYSPVFQRIFTSGMSDSQTNVIEIVSFRPEVVEAFVEYVHLGKKTEETSDEIAEELLSFAEKYDVVGALKDQCIDQLCQTLSPENILHRLVLAFTYDYAALKTKALKYATKPTDDLLTVLQSQEWLELLKQNKQIADEISKAALDMGGGLQK